MNVIKHHNKFQSDMPSHIREMAKESYLNIFCSTQIGSGVIVLALWDLSPSELKKPLKSAIKLKFYKWNK